MSGTPEPLSAILAEMRDFCSGWSEDVDVTVKVGLIYGWICRIEAAAERERKSLQGTIDKMRRAIAENAPGNAAAMREALEYAERWLHGILQFCDRRTRGEEIRVPALSAFGTVDRIRAALSAPARNCDRFATHNEAKAAFLHSYFGPTEPDFVENAFARWLFAPAQEGGDHA